MVRPMIHSVSWGNSTQVSRVRRWGIGWMGTVGSSGVMVTVVKVVRMMKTNGDSTSVCKGNISKQRGRKKWGRKMSRGV